MARKQCRPCAKDPLNPPHFRPGGRRGPGPVSGRHISRRADAETSRRLDRRAQQAAAATVRPGPGSEGEEADGQAGEEAVRGREEAGAPG
jgi:hypothetical protein